MLGRPRGTAAAAAQQRPRRAAQPRTPLSRGGRPFAGWRAPACDALLDAPLPPPMHAHRGPARGPHRCWVCWAPRPAAPTCLPWTCKRRKRCGAAARVVAPSPARPPSRHRARPSAAPPSRGLAGRYPARPLHVPRARAATWATGHRAPASPPAVCPPPHSISSARTPSFSLFRSDPARFSTHTHHSRMVLAAMPRVAHPLLLPFLTRAWPPSPTRRPGEHQSGLDAQCYSGLVWVALPAICLPVHSLHSTALRRGVRANRPLYRTIFVALVLPPPTSPNGVLGSGLGMFTLLGRVLTSLFSPDSSG